MIYRAISEGAMMVHFLVLAYLVLGGFVAWRWPRMIWPHLAICAWGVVQVAGLIECPLTAVENWGRARAGHHLLAPGGFIDTYIEGVIYPEAYATQARLLALVVVLISWAGFRIRTSFWRRTGTSPGRRATASR
jgi:hypothetical protein